MRKMELYIVRHGQSEANAAGRHAGWSPVPLSEKGREQAEKVGKYLAMIAFDRVIVSDVLRARQTAELAMPGGSYQLEPRIREINSGSLVGRYVTECIAEYGDAYLNAKQVLDYAAYGGETDAILAARIGSFMKDMEKEADAGHKREKIAVFSHECAMRRMICYAMGAEYPHKRIQLGNCAVVKLEYVDGGWRLGFILPLEIAGTCMYEKVEN